MKTRIFIFIIILAMLVACIGHLDSENDFMIRVGTGFKERTGNGKRTAPSQHAPI